LTKILGNIRDDEGQNNVLHVANFTQLPGPVVQTWKGRTSMTLHHRGACLCQGIRFTIAGELPPIQVCHCAQCRQAQGGPFAANIPVETSALKISSGMELLRRYESSPGKVRAFCSVCGSPIFSERASLPGVVRIRAGLLAEPVHAQLGFHAYTASKASWWPLDDGLPRHPEGFVPLPDAAS
jgi:hypothetical protein